MFDALQVAELSQAHRRFHETNLSFWLHDPSGFAYGHLIDLIVRLKSGLFEFDRP